MRIPSLFPIFASLGRRVATFIGSYGKTIVLSSVVTVVVVGGGMYSMKLRNKMIADLSAPKKSYTEGLFHATEPSSPSAALPTLLPTDKVLGSTDTDVSYTAPADTSYVPTAFPIPTFPTMMPLPTFAPVPTSAPPLNCAGTATENNSQVYVSSATAAVGAEVTITVELRDCNNNLASDDALVISLQNTDATAKVNGQSPSVTIHAKDGKASFTVSSQTAGTDTFLIRDTNQSFPVTMPGYHNPAVTFSNNSSGNSNCTTPGGTPNSWYSDVYPNPPVTTTTGSKEMQVIIRDCNKNPVSNDTIRVTIISGDSNAKINGSASPYTFTVSSGQGNFTVTSSVNGTVGLKVEDTTGSFTVTDASNHNPSIAFSGTSSPTPTPGPTSTPTAGPTPTTAAATPTPTSAAAPTTIPTSSPTPTP